MNDQLPAAWTSGLFALVVALLGIAGAIAAQFVATRRAFENSLALFERQATEDRYARAEAARMEERHRFADQKRSAYSRFLRLVDEISSSWAAAHAAEEAMDRNVLAPERTGSHADYLAQRARDDAIRAKENQDRAQRLIAELDLAAGEIDLLADGAVAAAVLQLRKYAFAADNYRREQYAKAREAFLLAAKRELVPHAS